jgi:NAD-dependent dihydropyrimidine dehydrogenase PreA subunit
LNAIQWEASKQTLGRGNFTVITSNAGGKIMAYVIAEPCIGVKDKACVEICPVDAIHSREEDAQMFIAPDVCCTCGACEPECPVGAIYEELEVPAKWRHYIELNAAHFA